jgi:hypothetical protein
MIKAILVLALAVTALPTFVRTEDPVGKPPPEFKATKWYNTAPLSLDDLKGKAVLLQVFRTW